MDPAQTDDRITRERAAASDGRYQGQGFSGFANLYRRFIRGFSSIASPLSALISPKVPFCCSNEAQNSFETLKTRLATAPILQIPEPDR